MSGDLASDADALREYAARYPEVVAVGRGPHSGPSSAARPEDAPAPEGARRVRARGRKRLRIGERLS